MKSPRYMLNFKCIGGDCEDNCCIGWDVDIDKETYIKYKNVTHPQMKRELDRYIKKNPASYDDKVDYAFAMLDANKHCTFLNADRLCMIHKHLGESFLSNVCGSFPRINNMIDGTLEQSATLSCPEIARLVLGSSSSMEILELGPAKPSSIITYDVKQEARKFSGKLPSKLSIVRDACMSCFEGESTDLTTVNQRLMKLGDFIIAADQLEKQKKLGQIEALIKRLGERAISFTKDDTQLKPFVSISEKLIKHLHHVGADDSIRYV
ncbi:MAG TPA: hypothetical protein DCS67_04900, partial [Clostridiales bacterium UBA8960]|nr:hypothetical protein [Clostridiales bacterium UBA8960]